MTTLKQFEILEVSPNTFMSMSPFRLMPNCCVLLCPARSKGHNVIIRLYNQSNTQCDLQVVFLISGDKFTDLEASIVKTIKGFPAWLSLNEPDQLVANIGLVKMCHHLNNRSVNLGVAREVPNYKASQLNGLNGEATNTDDIDAVNFTPAFALHGRYVGPGHTGALKLGQAYWQAPPIDELDAAARDHDWHYFMHPKNRAEADELLSRRAFAAIRNLPSWTAKAKALAVGLGMKIMSKIGSRNGEQLTFPPPIKRGRVRPFINGNNGEATNSDDVKGARKVVRGVMKAERRELKAIRKMAGVPKSKPSNRAPVVQGLMPTNMQTTYDIRPYYRTGKVGKYSREVKTLFSVGYAGGNGPAGANSTYLAGGVILSVALDKSLFAGQNIAQDFENYERWKIRSGRYHVLPNVASNTSGTVWGLPDPDAIDVLPLGTTVSPTVLNGHRNAVKHTIWAGQMTGNLVFNKAKLFTDVELVSFSSLNGSVNSQQGGVENRFYAAGVFSLLNGEGISTNQTSSFCEVFLEFDIEFSEPQNSDLGSLVSSVKAATLAGNTMPGFASGTGNDIGASVIRNFSSIANLTCEYVYNPSMYFPTGGPNSYYMLPVGTYLFTFGCDLPNTITGVSADIAVTVTGGVVSHTRFAAYDAANSFGNIEFTTAPATQAAGTTRFAGFFIIRISQVTTGNRLKLTLYPVLTFTGTGVLVSWHGEMMRVPDFASNPLSMFFPIGNGGQGLLIDKRKRLDLSVSNGMNNVKCAGVKGVLEEDVPYYEMKLRKRFPELNWSFEDESSDTRIIEWELPREKWPKFDAIKFREEEKVREAEAQKTIDADCKRDEEAYNSLCDQAERLLGPFWNKGKAKMFGPHWSLGWFKCECGDEFPWDGSKFLPDQAGDKGNHYHCMKHLIDMQKEVDNEVATINKDGAALLVDTLSSETPEMIENPLSKSVHLDPSFADTLLKAIQGKK